jgi:4'-phosphopantetheinyl transferase
VDLAVGESQVAAAERCLSRAELAWAATGTPGVRRRRVLMRAALRGLLSGILGTGPRDVALAQRPGPPALVEPVDRCAGRLDLSTSASGDVGVVVAAHAARVGVDVQRVGDEELATALADGWLAGTEHDRIAALPPDARSWALTRAWVQKEAVLKGRGVSLWGDPAGTVTPVADRGRVAGWQLIPLAAPGGYVASLALRPESWAARVVGDRLRSLPPVDRRR